MPRKAKDKEELVEKKDVKKENHRGRKAKNSITDKKSVSAKTEKKKTSSKKAKVTTSKVNESPKDSSYEKKYKESLSIRELTILSLYMIFPDDDKFMNMLYNYNYDFNKVAKLYSVNGTVVRLRYDCYMSLKNTKILELK